MEINTKMHYKQGKVYYELLEDVRLKGITIPKGFKSDGHSVPWIFRWLVSNHNLPIQAAFYHDYAYIHNPSKETRREVDENYYALMRNSFRCTWYHSLAAWLGVRLASWYWWNKYN